MAMGRCFTAPLTNFREVGAAMLDAVKLALRITTDAFDAQLNSLIAAAQLDLGVAGVVVPTTIDALVQMAVITYCRLHFGQPDDYDRLKKSYDEQKAQLATCTGYTDWLNGESATVGGVVNG